MGSAKAASKTSSKAFTEASSKLRRELNKARKVEIAVSEEARLTSRAARQFIRRECGAFRGPKRVARPVDFGRLFKKHGVKTAPGPRLQPLSEAELEKVVGGAKDPKWKPGSGNHVIGQNGVQVTSKTTWQSGKTERIDIENPLPGKIAGQIHYHEANNRKWSYDIVRKCFFDNKTGELAPPYIQKLLEDTNVRKAIEKAKKFLGE